MCSVAAALSAAAPRAQVTIRVAPGRYNERLVVDRPGVTIEAAAGGEGPVVFYISTTQPYQSVVDSGAALGTTLRGLTLQHYSKSVANNYAVFLHEGSDLVMEDCDVCSSSGSGIGVEGASPIITRCRVHDCVGNGLAVFGPLDTESSPPGGGLIQDCTVESCGKDGVLIRSGAEPRLTGCRIAGNKGHGLVVHDGGGTLEACTITGNARGAVLAVGAAEGFCVVDCAGSGGRQGSNTLQGAVSIS